MAMMKCAIVFSAGLFLGWNTTQPGSAKMLQNWVLPQLREMIEPPRTAPPVNYIVPPSRDS